MNGEQADLFGLLMQQPLSGRERGCLFLHGHDDRGQNASLKNKAPSVLPARE